MSSSERITQATFDGLAFPVAKVRYNGDSSNWSASVYRDRDRTFRARVSYDCAVGGGARGALPAALKAFEKARAEIDGLLREEYVAIPGDMDADFYVFTFVPARFFAVASSEVKAMLAIYGPAECRIVWDEDLEPYQMGDAEDPAETARYIDLYGVYGCMVQTRAPACPCCERRHDWETVESLWSIVGDADYHRLIETELLEEVCRAR